MLIEGHFQLIFNVTIKPITKVKMDPKSATVSGTFSVQHKEYMNDAMVLAYEALAAQEVPVGCIFVYEGSVIARGRNTVNETRNATRHAEFNCIDQVYKFCENSKFDPDSVFTNIEVYVTVEPCIMCAAALYSLSVKSVVYGCKNDRFGGQTVYDVASILNPKTVVCGGHRAEEALQLLKEFYKGTNPSAPPSKVKIKEKKGRKGVQDGADGKP